MDTDRSFFLFSLLAFFIGSFPTAYVAVRGLLGKDIRQLGSGNVGATNAVRALGKGPGIAVFAVDFLKGAVPVFLFRQYETGAAPASCLLIGSWAISGHVFTPFLKFKGGKGIATGGGALAASAPLIFLVAATVWGVIFLISRIVSLSSLVAFISVPLLALFWLQDRELALVSGFLTLFILWTHRSNISRLARQKEPTFRDGST